MVQIPSLVVALVATASIAQAAPIDKRAGGCSTYIIINTRGTGELQGPSSGFRTMNSNIQSKQSGGSVYNTVYPADFSQISTVGTNDIVNKVTKTLASAPGTCFVLEGYSQGAAATTNALSKLTGTAFDAVKAVFLIGNPEHRSGKACNVDTNGGKTTANVNGLSATLGGIPDDWISKTMDVCNYVGLLLASHLNRSEQGCTARDLYQCIANHFSQGDGVCDTTHGFGINAQHLAYPGSSGTQNMGTEFVLKMLQGTGTDASSTATGSADASSTDASSTGSTSSTDSSSSSSGLGSLGGLGGLSSGGSSGLGGLSGLGSSSSSGLGGFSNPFSGLMGGSSSGTSSSPFGSLGGLGGSSGSSSPFGSIGSFFKW